MKKMRFLALGCAIIAGTIFTSCKKEGCIDGDATNFDAEADEDNGSCVYSGEVVFWYGEASSKFLVGDGAVTLTYYVDGKIVGSTAANVFDTKEPECGQNGSITVSRDLGSAKSATASYSVKDQTDHEYYKGTVTFAANTCESWELK